MCIINTHKILGSNLHSYIMEKKIYNPEICSELYLIALQIISPEIRCIR